MDDLLQLLLVAQLLKGNVLIRVPRQEGEGEVEGVDGVSKQARRPIKKTGTQRAVSTPLLKRSKTGEAGGGGGGGQETGHDGLERVATLVQDILQETFHRPARRVNVKNDGTPLQHGVRWGAMSLAGEMMARPRRRRETRDEPYLDRASVSRLAWPTTPGTPATQQASGQVDTVITEEPETMMEEASAYTTTGQQPHGQRKSAMHDSTRLKSPVRAHFDLPNDADARPPDFVLDAPAEASDPLSWEGPPSEAPGTLLLTGLERSRISQDELSQILIDRLVLCAPAAGERPGDHGGRTSEEGEEDGLEWTLPTDFMAVVLVPLELERRERPLASHLLDHFVVSWTAPADLLSLSTKQPLRAETGHYDPERMDQLRGLLPRLHLSHLLAVQMRDLQVVVRSSAMYASGLGARAMEDLERVLRACTLLEWEHEGMGVAKTSRDHASDSSLGSSAEREKEKAHQPRDGALALKTSRSPTSRSSLSLSIALSSLLPHDGGDHQKATPPGLRPDLIPLACTLAWSHRLRIRTSEDERRLLWGANAKAIREERAERGVWGPLAGLMGARRCIEDGLRAMGMV